MMDYELFKKLVVQRIKGFLPPVYHSYEINVRKVSKVNEKKDAFCMIPPDNDGSIAIPTLYLDDIYRDFGTDEDLERILREMAAILMTYSGIRMPELAGFRLEGHTDCVIANLISVSMNEELLEKIPHKRILDMALIYRLVFSIEETGINSCIITNDILKDTEYTAEDLHAFAMKNTPRLFPAQIIKEDGFAYWIMTNNIGLCGATTMVYEEDMQKLAEEIGDDFFIIPTSIHEIFAIAVSEADPMRLVKMLADGNRIITEPQDQLSSNIYMYSAEKKCLTSVAAYCREAEDAVM